MASRDVASHAPLPPSDMLMILAGLGLSGTSVTLPPEAQVMPAAMSEV